METSTYFFNTLLTKSLEIDRNSDERIFKGILTVEIVDKQGEIVIVDELAKCVPIWLERGGPISDSHSNRIIGKGLGWEKTVIKGADGQEHPAILIIGKIFRNKQFDYELDQDIWNKIKSGEYKGLSFGGATRSAREPVNAPDGSLAWRLKDLEQYEVAVCKEPANHMALIVDVNSVAKSMSEDRGCSKEHKLVCTKGSCFVEKSLDITPEKAEFIYKQLIDIVKPIRGHDYDYWDKKLEKEGYDKDSRGKIIGSWEATDKKSMEEKKPDLPIEKFPEEVENKPDELEEKNKVEIHSGIRHNYSAETSYNQDNPEDQTQQVTTKKKEDNTWEILAKAFEKKEQTI